MSLSVTHMNVPNDYKFMCKYNVNDNVLRNIREFWEDKLDGLYDDDFACPSTNFYEFDGISVWINNQHKQGYIYVHFKSNEDYHSFLKNIENKIFKTFAQIKYPLYRFRQGWKLESTYVTKNAEKNIFGCDEYISQIVKDIENHIKYNKFLSLLDEVKSSNYLLFGPPGTGKTSMIRAIASKLGCPMFIVNAGELVHCTDLSQILSPGKSVHTECKVKLLLFEDFDRYLTSNNVSNVMSQILNALDGVDDNGDTVRFFTANNPESVLGIDALVNRMNAKYEFYFPTRDIFKSKLERFLTFYESYDKEKADVFLDLVVDKKVTVRPFTNYVIRYLFDDDYLDKMIKHIDEL